MEDVKDCFPKRRPGIYGAGHPTSDGDALLPQAGKRRASTRSLEQSEVRTIWPA